MVAVGVREYAGPMCSFIYERALGWYHKKIGHRFAKVRCCSSSWLYMDVEVAQKGDHPGTALAEDLYL